ncbi:hypothetical protein LCGC14_2903740 [marine sediment metagenome]|uniref:Uncharacterized protein n=1 Tax=marine sediment metagenome TaxID=412755 RepID=A0A0F9AJV7_9ZZZZ
MICSNDFVLVTITEMEEEYIIKIKLSDRNRNFGEITEQIEKFLKERDGVEDFCLYKEVDKTKVELKNIIFKIGQLGK